MNLLMFIGGLVLLVLGANVLVRGASKLALSFGISPLVVGLTIVAFGTSAPEVAVSVGAVLDGKTDIAIGNVVGSNIFNVLFILGASALIAPLIVNIQLIRAVLAFIPANILHRKAQHVFITDGIDNHILMQAFTKQRGGGLLVAYGTEGVIGKNRRAGKAEHLRVVKEFLDVLVGFTKLAAVAFIKNKHKLLILQVFNLAHITLFHNRVIKFLDGGHNQLGAVVS